MVTFAISFRKLSRPAFWLSRGFYRTPPFTTLYCQGFWRCSSGFSYRAAAKKCHPATIRFVPHGSPKPAATCWGGHQVSIGCNSILAKRHKFGSCFRLETHTCFHVCSGSCPHPLKLETHMFPHAFGHFPTCCGSILRLETHMFPHVFGYLSTCCGSISGLETHMFPHVFGHFPHVIKTSRNN